MKHQYVIGKCTLRGLAVLIAVTTGLTNVTAEGKPVNKSTANITTKENPAKKINTKSVFAPLNNKAVKIYPDMIKRNMHVVAKDNDGKQIEFLVFDLQGTLVQHCKMKGKDHFRITGLSRGIYIFRAFCGDEEMTTGKFEIR